MTKWYIKGKSKNYGPYSGEKIGQLIEQGKLGEHHSLSQDQQQWQKIGESPFVDDLLLSSDVDEGSLSDTPVNTTTATAPHVVAEPAEQTTENTVEKTTEAVLPHVEHHDEGGLSLSLADDTATALTEPAPTPTLSMSDSNDNSDNTLAIGEPSLDLSLSPDQATDAGDNVGIMGDDIGLSLRPLDDEPTPEHTDSDDLGLSLRPIEEDNEPDALQALQDEATQILSTTPDADATASLALDEVAHSALADSSTDTTLSDLSPLSSSSGLSLAPLDDDYAQANVGIENASDTLEKEASDPTLGGLNFSLMEEETPNSTHDAPAITTDMTDAPDRLETTETTETLSMAEPAAQASKAAGASSESMLQSTLLTGSQLVADKPEDKDSTDTKNDNHQGKDPADEEEFEMITGGGGTMYSDYAILAMVLLPLLAAGAIYAGAPRLVASIVMAVAASGLAFYDRMEMQKKHLDPPHWFWAIFPLPAYLKRRDKIFHNPHFFLMSSLAMGVLSLVIYIKR